jgi:methyl-accepting chemotaxis protein
LRRAGQAPKTMDLDAELISALDALLAQQKDVHDQAVKAQVAFESTAKILVLVPSLGGLIIGIVVAFLSGRAVSKAMSRVIDRVKEVAQGDGDLTRRLPVTSQDEIGELSGWFNMFIGRVHEIIVQVSANANRLASSGEEISTASAQQAQGAETQKDQVRQVATAMQEMSSTVLDVSQNSLRAADAAGKAAAMARQGGEIVEGTLTKIRAVSESVGQTAEQVQALGQRSDQIGEIIGVIDEIAGQTNLLALNAAIEAARAGEQGRGFAVVADEVRKLAERTSRATKEIAQMIQGIQAETRSAVQAMQAGTDQVEQGLNTTAQAGAALREIIKMAEQVGEMVTQIATASTEQSSATEEVSSSVEQISRITEESASGAMQSAKACHELSEMALDLQNLVSQFKLEEHKRPVVLSARLARAA